MQFGMSSKTQLLTFNNCFSFIDRPEVEYKNPDVVHQEEDEELEVEAVAEKQKENQHLLPKISTKNWIII